MSDEERCTACGLPLRHAAGADRLCSNCLLKLGFAAADANLPPDIDSPVEIDGYRILDCLGEGGMGIVYLAEQREPLVRLVALKVLKAGLDTREIVARFNAERQALALMDHRCIAQVYAAGATVDGRLYFAMEYVAGVPITEYCDRHRLATPTRLELLLAGLCQAVAARASEGDHPPRSQAVEHPRERRRTASRWPR